MTEKKVPAPIELRAIDLLKNSPEWMASVRYPYEIKDEEGNILLTLYFKPRTRASSIEIRAFIETLKPKNASELMTYWLIKVAQLEDGSPAFALGDFHEIRSQLNEVQLNELEEFALNPCKLPKKDLTEQVEDEKKD